MTLLASTLPPLLLSAEPLLRLPAVLIGSMVRVDRCPTRPLPPLIADVAPPHQHPAVRFRAPGTLSPWVPNAVIAVLIAVLILSCLVFALPYTHRSGKAHPTPSHPRHLIRMCTDMALCARCLSVVGRPASDVHSCQPHHLPPGADRPLRRNRPQGSRGKGGWHLGEASSAPPHKPPLKP